MLTAIAHCQKENAQVKQLAEWMAELGPYPNHRLLVGRDEKAEPNLFANSGFSNVEEITVIGDVWNHWPESCNNAFRQIAKYIEYGSKEPWLWCEADCVPLSKDWLDKIEAEYQEALRHGKVFLGDFVHINEPGFIDHMSGVAVYPGVMSDHAGDALLAHEIAWDCYAASQILPRMQKSKLILHRWKYPAFESREQVEKSIFQVKPDCVLFHANKDGSLIPLLRDNQIDLRFQAAEEKFGPAFIERAREEYNRLADQKEHALNAVATEIVQSTDDPAFIKSWAATTKSESTATSPVVANLNRDSREVLLHDVVAILKQFCTAPRYISQVRKELKLQGVIK